MSSKENMVASLNSANLGQHKSDDSADITDLINTLSKRRVKLREWIEKAWTFYEQAKYDNFAVLLENAITRGSKSYVDYKNDLLRSNMMLAAHFVRLACCEPGQKRGMWQEKVATMLLAVDNLQLVSNEVPHLLCRGFALMLIDSQLQDADNCFVTVLRQVPNDVTALLGRGCLAYNRQEYRVALGYFKNVLLHYPQGPLDVRVGIAHCFLKLDDTASARRAFELALANNGRCLNALLGMAQLKLNERTRPANLEAINLLCAAYELNQHHPLVLSWLAGYLYYSRDYETLQVAAGNAYVATDNELLKAQNCFQIARSFHAMQNYERAFDFYGKAVGHSAAGYAPPHLGLAQIYVRRGQLDKAENSLRALLKLLPDQPQALRMLATLYAQADSESKLDMAIHLFNKALREDDYDTYLGLAATYERKQLWQEALDSYDHAIRIYQRLHNTTIEVPLTWLNNVAALQMHAEKPKAALQTLDKALSMTPDATQEHYESNLLTLRFNRARVLEELHLVEQAENSYQQLIVEYPNYYDCYLRLGTMSYKRNKLKDAMEKYEAVLRLDSENEAANIYLGNCRVKQGDLECAMHNYQVVMQRSDNADDSYMLVAMGNLGLFKMQRAIEDGDYNVIKHQAENALQLFRKALEQNQRNLWAANGIGVALSNYGNLSDGDTIFKQIIESTKRWPDVILNSAHVALKLEHYSEAIETFKQYLKEVPLNNCVDVMQLLARSLFQVGRIKEAKEWLSKARHVDPNNLTLLYNLAIATRQEGSDIFGMNGSNLVELQRAEQALKLAQGFFHFLGQKVETSTNHANICSQLLENAPAELKNWRILENQRQNQLNKEKLKKIEQNNPISQEISKNIPKELFAKPKLDREPSIRTKKMDREASTRAKKMEREPSVRPNKLAREPSVRPNKPDREPSTKPKKMDREPSNKQMKMEREPSTKPRKLDREPSVKPKKLDREASTINTKKEEKISLMNKENILIRKIDKQLTPKKDEKNLTLVKEETIEITTSTTIEPKNKTNKRKHKSKDKKERESSTEPKDKKKKKKK